MKKRSPKVMESPTLEIRSRITGADMLNCYPDGWPCFADAEVLHVSFDCGNLLWASDQNRWDLVHREALTASFAIPAPVPRDVEPSAEPSWNILTLSHEGLYRLRMTSFTYQNPILSYDIGTRFWKRLNQDVFVVRWGGLDHSVAFECEAIRIVSMVSVPDVGELYKDWEAIVRKQTALMVMQSKTPKN